MKTWTITWAQFQELDLIMSALRAVRGMGPGELTNPQLNVKIEWDNSQIEFQLPIDE